MARLCHFSATFYIAHAKICTFQDRWMHTLAPTRDKTAGIVGSEIPITQHKLHCSNWESFMNLIVLRTIGSRALETSPR